VASRHKDADFSKPNVVHNSVESWTLRVNQIGVQILEFLVSLQKLFQKKWKFCTDSRCSPGFLLGFVHQPIDECNSQRLIF